jgi:hypothetical protein
MLNWFSAPLAPLTWNPPSISPEFTDGVVKTSDWKLRPFGSLSISSEVMLFAISVVVTSITGAASVTWIVCSVAPTVILALTVNTRPTVTITSGTWKREKPVNSKLTV